MDQGAGTGRLQDALGEIRRKLQKDREEAELLTHHIAVRRDKGDLVEDSRVKKLELELATAQKELAEQKEAALSLAQQLAAGREAGRAQMREGEPRARKLEVELSQAQEKLQNQKEAAERLIQQFAAERDESRAQLPEGETPIPMFR